MGIIDLLLETDMKKLQENNKKEYEIKRLTNILGEKFTVTCQALTHEQVIHIGEVSKTNAETKFNAIVEACKIEGKRFNNKELMDKFGVIKPIDLLDKLFLPGEISRLYDIVNKLSGYGKDVIEEVKNS